MDRVKRIWYLSPMRAAKVQASLRIRAVSPEPSLLAQTSSESRGTFRQEARSLTPLNGWACAVKMCHDGMLEDTNSLDGAHMMLQKHVRQSDCSIQSATKYTTIRFSAFTYLHYTCKRAAGIQSPNIRIFQRILFNIFLHHRMLYAIIGN